MQLLQRERAVSAEAARWNDAMSRSQVPPDAPYGLRLSWGTVTVGLAVDTLPEPSVAVTLM